MTSHLPWSMRNTEGQFWTPHPHLSPPDSGVAFSEMILYLQECSKIAYPVQCDR